jgi:hypothetical protein
MWRYADEVKERVELAQAEAAFNVFGDAVTGYFEEPGTSPPASKKSMSGPKSEESDPSDSVPPKQENVQL